MHSPRGQSPSPQPQQQWQQQWPQSQQQWQQWHQPQAQWAGNSADSHNFSSQQQLQHQQQQHQQMQHHQWSQPQFQQQQSQQHQQQQQPYPQQKAEVAPSFPPQSSLRRGRTDSAPRQIDVLNWHYSVASEDGLILLQIQNAIEGRKISQNPPKAIQTGQRDEGWKEYWLKKLEGADAVVIPATAKYYDKLDDVKKSALKWEGSKIIEKKEANPLLMVIVHDNPDTIASQLVQMLKDSAYPKDYNYRAWKKRVLEAIEKKDKAPRASLNVEDPLVGGKKVVGKSYLRIASIALCSVIGAIAIYFLAYKSTEKHSPTTPASKACSSYTNSEACPYRCAWTAAACQACSDDLVGFRHATGQPSLQCTAYVDDPTSCDWPVKRGNNVKPRDWCFLSCEMCKAEYVVIIDNECPGAFIPIHDDSVCQAAAVSLGPLEYSLNSDSSSSQSGCFLDNNKVYFNSKSSWEKTICQALPSVGDCVKILSEPVCSCTPVGTSQYVTKYNHKGSGYSYSYKIGACRDYSCGVSEHQIKASTACAAEKSPYVIGTNGRFICPAGYTNIVNESQCQSAAADLGLNDRTDDRDLDSQRSNGCFRWDGSAYFNRISNRGKPLGKTSSVCAQANTRRLLA